MKDYVGKLEKTLMDTCGSFDLHGYTNQHVGVWVDDKKIAAIGQLSGPIFGGSLGPCGLLASYKTGTNMR